MNLSTGSRITWRESINDGLSRYDWPMGMVVGGVSLCRRPTYWWQHNLLNLEPWVLCNYREGTVTSRHLSIHFSGWLCMWLVTQSSCSVWWLAWTCNQYNPFFLNFLLLLCFDMEFFITLEEMNVENFILRYGMKIYQRNFTAKCDTCFLSP